MILVDDRAGSIDLIPYLQSHPSAPPISSTRLPAGDVAFDGHGPKGINTIFVGIEYKRIHDMMNSIRSGRYSGHQLPELLNYYDQYYLILEGPYREGDDGNLQSFSSKDLAQEPRRFQKEHLTGRWFTLNINTTSQHSFRYTELDHFLCTLESHTPVKIRRSLSIHDTVSQIVSLFTQHWEWRAKDGKWHPRPWDSHHGYEAIHTPQTVATIGKAGLVRKVAASLSGIGWERSGEVAIKFNTVKDMIEAGPKEWATIPGIGKVLAERVFKQLRGEWKDPGEL